MSKKTRIYISTAELRVALKIAEDRDWTYLALDSQPEAIWHRTWVSCPWPEYAKDIIEIPGQPEDEGTW